MSRGRFFLPGPTEVRPAILRAMARPMIPHRGPQCGALLRRIEPGLQALFGTSRPILHLVSSATGVMEMGVRALPPGPLLVLVNGAFSERFVRIAQATGREVDPLERPWGESHEPGDVAAALRRRRYAGAAVVHVETSTGALQPLEEIARICDVPMVVDAVSSVGGMPVATDAWNLAWCCSASQKALGLPPGISFAVASESLLGNAPVSSLYFDLAENARVAAAHQPLFTPALPLLYALDAQLEAIAKETPDKRFARHAAMARIVWRWAETRGIGILARCRAPTVTCLRAPAGLTGPEIARRAAARGFVIGTGYGKMQESTFRIGHMGDATPASLRRLLAALDEAIAG